jgi:hypothetical protein
MAQSTTPVQQNVLAKAATIAIEMTSTGVKRVCIGQSPANTFCMGEGAHEADTLNRAVTIHGVVAAV